MGPKPVRDVDEVVEAVLASSRALVALSARSIGAVPGVTMPQFRMLVVLSEGPTNLTNLATMLDVVASTALRMVDRLVSADLVQRNPSPRDRREIVLDLTAKGRRVVTRVHARRRRDLRTVIERIPESRREALVEAMLTFAQATEELWGWVPASA